MLELLQPGTGQDLFLAFGTPACTGEKKSLLLDHFVIQWVSLALVVSSPVRQGLLDIRDTTLGALDGRPATIIGVEIFFLLAQDFGNSTRCRSEQELPTSAPMLFTFVPHRTMLQCKSQLRVTPTE